MQDRHSPTPKSLQFKGPINRPRRCSIPISPTSREQKTELIQPRPTFQTINSQKQGGSQKRGPISGGMLNGKAIYLPMPEAPPGDAGGVVLVAVLVDEQGSVIEARAVSGPAHLHTAAVSAARLARFSPTLLMGEPVKVSGTLSYSFAKSN